MNKAAEVGNRPRNIPPAYNIVYQWKGMLNVTQRSTHPKFRTEVLLLVKELRKSLQMNPPDKWTSNLSHCYSICLFLSSLSTTYHMNPLHSDSLFVSFLGIFRNSFFLTSFYSSPQGNLILYSLFFSLSHGYTLRAKINLHALIHSHL